MVNIGYGSLHLERGCHMKKGSAFWDALDKLVATSEVVIDRPKGTRHPKYPDMLG
jgi:hypothetical protein